MAVIFSSCHGIIIQMASSCTGVNELGGKKGGEGERERRGGEGGW